MIEIITGVSGVGKTTYLKNKLNKLKPKEVAYLPQEIAGIFNPTRTIYSQIHEVKFNKEDFNYLLEKLNLKYLQDSFKRYPYEFSMGELQRIALVLIFLNPLKKQIFLDEPTAFLDKKNRSALIDVLKLQKIPITLVTHNLDFALKLGGNIKVMNENQELYDFIPKTLERNNSLEISSSLPSFTSLKEAKIILITGVSGIGKTLYMKKFHKYLVSIDEKVAFLSQDYAFSLSPLKSVLKTLLEAIKVREKRFYNTKKDIIAIIRIFREMKLSTKLLKKYPYQLSIGEKQKILILRVILLNIKRILLDEPTSAMDSQSEENIIDFLLQIQNEYNTQLGIITHSNLLIKTLSPMADYTIKINRNNKLESELQ